MSSSCAKGYLFHRYMRKIRNREADLEKSCVSNGACLVCLPLPGVVVLRLSLTPRQSTRRTYQLYFSLHLHVISPYDKISLYVRASRDGSR